MVFYLGGKAYEPELELGHFGEEVAAEVVGVHQPHEETERFFVRHLCTTEQHTTV